jgi:hypothetical protein
VDWPTDQRDDSGVDETSEMGPQNINVKTAKDISVALKDGSTVTKHFRINTQTDALQRQYRERWNLQINAKYRPKGL